MIKASIPWTAKQIAKMYGNSSLKFDNVIQRGEVWNDKQKTKFIDSLLRGFVVPPIFTIKTDAKIKDVRGREVACYDCIDGKQRSTTIYQFRNNEFSLSYEKNDTTTIYLENGEEVELQGLTYDELPEELRDAFDSYTITVFYFTDITDDEIIEMMWRLNNGKPLSNVEKSRIKAKDLTGIMALASHEVFKDYLTATAIKGYNNEDIVIKNYIQYVYVTEPSFDSKKTREVYANHVFTDAEKARYNGIFDKTWMILSTIESNAPKIVFQKAIKKTNFLAIMSLAELEQSAEEIADKVTAFFTTEDGSLSVNERYNDASKNGSNHAPQVLARNEIIRNFVTSCNE